MEIILGVLSIKFYIVVQKLRYFLYTDRKWIHGANTPSSGNIFADKFSSYEVVPFQPVHHADADNSSSFNTVLSHIDISNDELL
ncbi:hypothetical protein GJ496_003860 [Pomphorhynchus laevis]|nr:hypothetical protein GJ496_003860 [Pomphorhynchus laevis]